MTESERAAVENGVENARKHGVRIVSVSALVRRINLIKDFLALCALVRLMRREKPDIVHTHTSKAGILGRLAARIARVSHIIHTPHGHVFHGHFGVMLSRIFTLIEKFFANLTDRLITVSNGEMKDYIDFNVCPAKKLINIHSGVEINKFKRAPINLTAQKRALGIDQSGPIIGFIGWLLPVKGPMHLLNAMEDVWLTVPEAKLVFIGKGELDVDLRTEALRSRRNSQVKFLGWRDDIHEIMPLFDILVLPSLNEGMGRVLVEAMAAGRPVVASNVGGIPDLVEHEKSGLLVPPGDEKALAAGIKQLIADPPTAKLMGLRGKALSDQFSVESMVEKIDNLYRELLNSHQPFRFRNTYPDEEFFFAARSKTIKEKAFPSNQEKPTATEGE